MQGKQAIQKEAAVLCKYLVGEQSTPHIQRLYAAVVGREKTALGKKDQRIMRYVLRHPRQIVYIDSALALVRPSAALRQRLYAMFAITEATSEHARRYLPVTRPLIYVIVIGLTGLRAAWRAVVGLVLLRVAERRK